MRKSSYFFVAFYSLLAPVQVYSQRRNDYMVRPNLPADPATPEWLIFTISCLVIILAFAGFVFWLWMLIDAVKRDERELSNKVVWIILMILVGVPISIAYYFMEKRKFKN